MVHTLRFSEDEEKKFKELYGDLNLNFGKIVKKKLFQTHTEKKRQNDVYMMNLGNLSTHINMLEDHISKEDTVAVGLLNSMKTEVKCLWRSL